MRWQKTRRSKSITSRNPTKRKRQAIYRTLCICVCLSRRSQVSTRAVSPEFSTKKWPVKESKVCENKLSATSQTVTPYQWTSWVPRQARNRLLLRIKTMITNRRKASSKMQLIKIRARLRWASTIKRIWSINSFWKTTIPSMQIKRCRSFLETRCCKGFVIIKRRRRWTCSQTNYCRKKFNRNKLVIRPNPTA